MRKILEKCPSCDGDLIITQLSCTRCTTAVNGHFLPTLFAQLSEEELYFITVFVKNRGNVKEMERELGTSYWSIRSQLNDVIKKLGFAASEEKPAGEDPEKESPGRMEILAMLDEGRISAEEAAKLLARLSRKS